MNDFNKSLEFKYPKLPRTSQEKKGITKSLFSENFRSDNLAVGLLILVGIIGLSYIPKSPFEDHIQHHSNHSPLTSNNAYASGFSFSSSSETTSEKPVLTQSHPLSFKLSASQSAEGSVQFELEGIHEGWSYQLKIADQALLNLDQGACDWQFDQAGIYSVELKAQRNQHSELLEIREVIIE